MTFGREAVYAPSGWSSLSYQLVLKHWLRYHNGIDSQLVVTVAHALGNSRMDYSDVLYIELHLKMTPKPWLVQSIASRIKFSRCTIQQFGKSFSSCLCTIKPSTKCWCLSSSEYVGIQILPSPHLMPNMSFLLLMSVMIIRKSCFSVIPEYYVSLRETHSWLWEAQVYSTLPNGCMAWKVQLFHCQLKTILFN